MAEKRESRDKEQQQSSGSGSGSGSGRRERTPSPNPFLSYLGTSPARSEAGGGGSATPSPRSPRFQTEFFTNGTRIPPTNGAGISQAMLTTASPPRFATIDQFMMASNAVQNMALAHEISVNQNFKLEKPTYEENSLERQIHDTVHKAFWNALREDFERQPRPDYKHALVIIGEAKQGLLSLLLPNHVKFREQIEHVVDLELIAQQMEHDTFDYLHYARFIVDIMGKLCAPARDADIERLRALTEPVELFKGIMETLELLKLDMANFTIQQMRPHIQQQVVAYEQKKFAELLETQRATGIDGLEATKAWLARAKRRIADSASIGQYRYEAGATPSSVCNEAFMEMFVWTCEHTFPETLAMDEMRFNEVYIKCRKFLVVCAIVNTVFALVGESVRGLDELRAQLRDHVLVLLDDHAAQTFDELMRGIGDECVKLTDAALGKHGQRALDAAQITCLKGLIQDLSSKGLHDNSVYKLLFARYIEFLQGVLTKRTQGPVRLPQGMSVMEKELLQVTGQFLRLVTFNKTVFGSYYGEIIEALPAASSS